VVAFGATFGWSTTKSGFQALTQITVSGNSDTLFSQVLTPGAATTPVYLGLAGTGSFSTITISSNFATGFGLNNFSYALESADTGIPEPGTMLLIGTGLFMVPLLKRLRRRRRA
jgi:hypothetical protein